MKIACLQFAPKVGDVDNNLNKADSVLNHADPGDLDLLVLPELAFTGYNFKSLREISPYLEPTGSGLSSCWAKNTALNYDCTVIAGYPEKVDVTDKWPADPEYYNSAVVVNSDGETIANYQKTHLYYTDETWALEGPNGFYKGRIPGIGRTAIGICMDINPHRFEAPWDDFEFAHHAIECGARLIILSMAWLTQDDPLEFTQTPEEPDMDTLMYWIARLEPIVRLELDQEIIIVFANRTGIEDAATYAGTSAVIGIKNGEVLVYGILGRGDQKLLLVDTDDPPYARLVLSNPKAEDTTMNLGAPGANDRKTSISHGSHTRGNDPSNDLRTTPDAKESSHLTLRAQPSEASFYRNEDLDRDPIHLTSQNHPAPTSSLLEEYRDGQESGHSQSNDVIKTRNDSTYESKQLRKLDSYPSTQGSLPDLESKLHQPFIAITKGSRAPQSQPMMSAEDTQWPTPDDLFESWITSLEPGLVEHESGLVEHRNRHSLRSDVAVWSDHAGRPSTAEAPLDPQVKMAVRKVEEYLRGSTPSTGTQYDTSRFTELRPRDQTRTKSRHDTRTPGHGRSKTSAPNLAQQKASHRKHISDVNRIRSAQDHRADTANRITETFSPGRDSARNTRYRESAPISSAQEPQPGILSRAASIPITMDPKVGYGSRESASGPYRPGHERELADINFPILKPVSISRIEENGENGRGRDAERLPYSNATPQPDRFPSSTLVKESRQTSRGRQRTSKPKFEQNPLSTMSPSRQGSQNHRAADPIDLSQFNLIEEYPSAACPLHGSRSRSRTAKHGTGSRRMTPSNGHKRPGSRDVQEPRYNSRETSTPKQSSKKKAIASRKMTRSVQLGVKNSQQGGDRLRITELTARLNLKDGPKTPVAMVLVNDTKDEPKEGSKLPLGIYGAKAPDSGISRPRSAVW